MKTYNKNFLHNISVAVGATTAASTSVDTGLSPKASSLTDTPPAKLIAATESGSHIPKEPFRRRKVSEIRRKDSSSGPETSVTTKPQSKKRTVSSSSGSTQEITITRITHPKKVESAVIEVQTDFDDDIREIKVIPGISTRFARSTSIGTDPSSSSTTHGRRPNKSTGQETTLSPVLCESETQVESTEIGVQHAEVGIGTETEPPQENKKTTVDIGIQTGNPEEYEHQESPRMMSIAIQAEEEEETMKSVGVGDSPPPQETVTEVTSSRAITWSRQHTQPEGPTIESLPVSLPISGLTLNSGSQNGQSRTETSNKKQKSKSSHFSYTDHDDINGSSKELKSQEINGNNADDQSSKAKQSRGRPGKSQRKKTDSPSIGREQAANDDMTVRERNTDSDINSSEHSSGAAHVSVIKRTPEKRGGSRPFGRPKDLPLHAPAIDTAQIASLLNESPPESEKAAKKAKSPGRSPGRSPAARVNDRQYQGATYHTDSQDSTADTANVVHTVADVHIQENVVTAQEQPSQKKRRGRPRKIANLKRPVGRPRKNKTFEIPKTPANRIRDNSEESESGSPKRKKLKSAEESASPTRSSVRNSNNIEDKSPTRSCTKKHNTQYSSEKFYNKVQNKKNKRGLTGDDDTDSEVEEITKKTRTDGKKKKKTKSIMIPPAFPEKDPYDFDALSVSDFEPLPDLRTKRKRRKSRGFDFELESRRKKKKKKKPSTPEDR